MKWWILDMGSHRCKNYVDVNDKVILGVYGFLLAPVDNIKRPRSADKEGVVDPGDNEWCRAARWFRMKDLWFQLFLTPVVLMCEHY